MQKPPLLITPNLHQSRWCRSIDRFQVNRQAARFEWLPKSHRVLGLVFSVW